jgi:hypothetical protein
MFCIDCGYELHGLQEHRCPECGRDFDPGVEATFARTKRVDRLSRALIRGYWVLVTGSGGFIAPFINYALAWAVLGRQPAPMMDDPKHLDGIGWFHPLCLLWVMASVICTRPATMIPVLVAVRTRQRRLKWKHAIGATIPLLVFALMLTGFQCARGVRAWFLD